MKLSFFLLSVFLIVQAEHKLKPFHGARVCFVGFPEEEEKHMSEILLSNGGTVTQLDDATCTHIVSTLTFLMHFFIVVCIFCNLSNCKIFD